MVDPDELRSTVASIMAIYGDTKLASLYDGIVSGSYATDCDAQGHLYPGEDSTNSYRKLKSSLKKQLKEAVLLFDERKPDFNDYQKAYYQCHKEWAAVKILLGRNAREVAVDIAQSLLNRSRKYEFSDLAMDMASVLRLHYGARMGDGEKFQIYNNLLKEYRKLFFLEQEAQEAYIDLVINYVNNRSPKSEQHTRAKAASDRLHAAIAGKESRQLQLYVYLIDLMVCTTVYNYSGALQVCQEAIEYFENKPYCDKLPLQIFYYQELVCYIQLCQFNEGKEVADKCLEFMVEGSFNWFKYQELYFILAMHTSEYENGVRIFEEATQHPRFSFLPENVREIWKIYEAYLYFLKTLDKIQEMPQSTDGYNSFRLSRFLNEVIVFSKDKSGLNAAILIAQIMTLISEKRHEEAIDRLDTTQQYCYRYLKTEHTRRTYYFLKMMLKIPHLGFNKEAILQKTQKILDQLKATPLEVANQAVEVEIIPYEVLWEYLLQTLDTP